MITHLKWRPGHAILPTGVAYDPDRAIPDDVMDPELFATLFGERGLMLHQRLMLLSAYRHVAIETTKVLQATMRKHKS